MGRISRMGLMGSNGPTLFGGEVDRMYMIYRIGKGSVRIANFLGEDGTAAASFADGLGLNSNHGGSLAVATGRVFLVNWKFF